MNTDRKFITVIEKCETQNSPHSTGSVYLEFEYPNDYPNNSQNDDSNKNTLIASLQTQLITLPYLLSYNNNHRRRRRHHHPYPRPPQPH